MSWLADLFYDKYEVVETHTDEDGDHEQVRSYYDNAEFPAGRTLDSYSHYVDGELVERITDYDVSNQVYQEDQSDIDAYIEYGIQPDDDENFLDDQAYTGATRYL